LPANANQFPSSAPIWGLGQNALVTDVIIIGSGFSEQTDANVYAITPSDSTPLTEVVSKLTLGTAGDVALITETGTTITLHALAAGVIHTFPFRIAQIKATGTL
jgi:hypothetical protein